MLSQGPLQRRSETCSRPALDHNRYFWLSIATFAPTAVFTTPQPSAWALLVSYRTLAARQRAKTARIGALIALSCRNKATRCHIDAFAVD